MSLFANIVNTFSSSFSSPWGRLGGALRLGGASLLFIVLFGCMREDLSQCLPDENLVLRFSYQSAGKEQFREIASSVDLFLFDEEMTFVNLWRIEKEELADSVSLWVEPGAYHLVCWVNKEENTYWQEIGEGTSFADCYLTYHPQAAGDPLYYGPIEMATHSYEGALLDIQEREQTDYTIHLQPSHRVLHIYVEGMQDVYMGENLLPRLEVYDVPQRYDFFMALQKDRFTTFASNSRTVERNGREMAYSRFYLPLFDREAQMDVKLIKNSNNTEVTTFNLQQYIKENELESELEINIHIGFFSSGIEIKIPGWNSSENVSPEF